MGAAIECFPRAGAVLVPRTRFAPVKTTGDLLALRSDAPSEDAMLYGTANGGTNWYALDIGPIALASLTLARGSVIRGSATGTGEALALAPQQIPYGGLADVLAGDLDHVVEPLLADERERLLAEGAV
jgi:hypothetical protein